MSKYIEEVMDNKKHEYLSIIRKSTAENVFDKIWDWHVSALQKQIEMIEGEVKETQEKFYTKDIRTGEVTYTGNQKCRTCERSRDCLSVSDILSILNQYK